MDRQENQRLSRYHGAPDCPTAPFELELREVSIAVKDPDTAAWLSRLLNAPQSPEVEVPQPPIQARFKSLGAGGASIAVMEATEEDSPLGRFLDKRGPGLFSITVRVSDIRRAMQHFRELGCEFVLPDPLVLPNHSTGFKQYAESRVNFTRPSTSRGLLIELQELREMRGQSE